MNVSLNKAPFNLYRHLVVRRPVTAWGISGIKRSKASCVTVSSFNLFLNKNETRSDGEAFLSLKLVDCWYNAECVGLSPTAQYAAR